MFFRQALQFGALTVGVPAVNVAVGVGVGVGTGAGVLFPPDFAATIPAAVAPPAIARIAMSLAEIPPAAAAAAMTFD